MRALVIDDSRAMRALLRRLLSGFGFEVAEAADVQGGLDRLDREPLPQLALVDWNLPGGPGLDFVRAVRGRRDIRVLMITTEVGREQLSRALEAGAGEYLMKPFTPEALREKLALLGFRTEEAAGA